MEALLFIISFLFVFGLVVFVHELGHFVAAKTSGLTVLEFGFGYPPAAFKKKIGETTYSLNWIPFGGFVKILGEEGEEGKNKKSFASQTKLTKAKILVAGVFMNYVLAVVIFVGLYAFGFSPIIPGAEKHYGVSPNLYIESVVKGTPADKEGLKSGDKILQIDGRSIKSASDLQDMVGKTKNKEMEIIIDRNGERVTGKIASYLEKVDGQEKVRIGVSIKSVVKADNIFFAVAAGLSESFRLSVLAVSGIFSFFFSLFAKLTIGDGAVGPVGMAIITNEMRKLGIDFLMQFVAVISLSLAFLNIMPIPALDGGQLFMIILEKIRGKDIKNETKNKLALFGFSFMILLMLIITSKDLVRFDIIGTIKRFLGW